MRAFTIGWLCSLPLACSANGADNEVSVPPGSGGSSSGGSAAMGGGASGSWSGGNGGSLFVDAGADAEPEACAKVTHTAEPVPLDLVILLDHSSSMGLPTASGTLWASVTTALSDFVSSPEAAGIGVSLHFFPQPGISSQTSCDPNVYAQPAVAMQTLPAGAAMITTALSQEQPMGVTPTAPALEGAFLYAKQWLATHPGHKAAVVLATDGLPSTCSPKDVPSIAAIAAGAFEAAPSIPTFVVGVGAQLSNLHAIAAGGGTKQAHLVDSNAQAGEQFLAALLQIQGAALGCEYALPKGESVDPAKVNVDYTPGGGSPSTIPAVTDAAQCGAGGGWYYDDPAAPTKVMLCDATCKTVQADDAAQLGIVLGCATVVKPPT